MSENLENEELVVMIGLLTVAAIFILVILAVNVAICWFLMTVLRRVPAEHRKMEPGMVWLLLIPCFNLVWNFFVFLRVPESFLSYFAAIGKTDQGDCGRGIGLWYAISSACCIVPLVNYIAGPAALVLLIIFLVKVSDLKNRLPPAPAAV